MQYFCLVMLILDVAITKQSERFYTDPTFTVASLKQKEKRSNVPTYCSIEHNSQLLHDNGKRNSEWKLTLLIANLFF